MLVNDVDCIDIPNSFWTTLMCVIVSVWPTEKSTESMTGSRQSVTWTCPASCIHKYIKWSHVFLPKNIYI